jgi:hypothetical protein
MNTRHFLGRSARTAAVLVVGLMSTVGAVSAASTADAAPYCGIVWGSLEKGQQPDVPRRHQQRPGRTPRLLRPDGRRHRRPGRRLPRRLRRRAAQRPHRRPGLPARRRQARHRGPRAHRGRQHGFAGLQTANPNELVNVTGWTTFRQIKLVGPSFEGVTQIGLGVRARLPFRVFTLTGPGSMTRLVIDVAQPLVTTDS